ncbi:Putative lipoprotein [Paraburkholderia xenovorans LB400]|uniref:Lipoprotein n=2 Tax=Burkholderiales TaxID=80840 RepID=Q13TN1_PARXL|nr:Putative lipoprotein [Paraburkholderia xenovorans LB400]
MSTSRILHCFMRVAAWLTLGAALLPLGGCAVAALPCRLTSATLKIIPVVGHAAASPFDMCSSAID